MGEVCCTPSVLIYWETEHVLGGGGVLACFLFGKRTPSALGGIAGSSRPFQRPGPPGRMPAHMTSPSVQTQIQALRVRECCASSRELLQRHPLRQQLSLGRPSGQGRGEESGPGDQSAGALGCLIFPPRNSHGPKCASHCLYAPHLAEPPVPTTNADGTHPFPDAATASAPVAANSDLFAF